MPRNAAKRPRTMATGRNVEAVKLKKSRARHLAVARLAKLQKKQILAASAADDGRSPEGGSPITAVATSSYTSPPPTQIQEMEDHPSGLPDNSLMSPIDLTQESMNYQNPHNFLAEQAPYGNVSSRPNVIKGSQSAKENKVRVLGMVSKSPFLHFYDQFIEQEGDVLPHDNELHNIDLEELTRNIDLEGDVLPHANKVNDFDLETINCNLDMLEKEGFELSYIAPILKNRLSGLRADFDSFSKIK